MATRSRAQGTTVITLIATHKQLESMTPEGLDETITRIIRPYLMFDTPAGRGQPSPFNRGDSLRIGESAFAEFPEKRTEETFDQSIEPCDIDCPYAGKWGATGRMPVGHIWVWRNQERTSGYLGHREVTS